MGSHARDASTTGTSSSTSDATTSSGPGNAASASAVASNPAGADLEVLASTLAPPAGSSTGDRAEALARSSRAEELIRHTTTAGEGTAELAAIMRRLQAAPDLATAHADLETLALMRGDPDVSRLEADYGRYLAQRQADLLVDGEYEALDERAHPTFMGSAEQLAYGRVVGDVIGMDPVMAALLNPSGGLVGPGNNAVERPRFSSIGAHGIVHDAMGYLTNHGFGGPGYDYLGDDALGPVLGAGNPLTGQESGTGFWSGYDDTSGVAQGGGAVAGIGVEAVDRGASWVGDRLGEGVDAVGGALGSAADAVGEGVTGLVDGAGALLGGAEDAVLRELGVPRF